MNKSSLSQQHTLTSIQRNVEIIRYPDDRILNSIAQKHGDISEKVFSGLTNIISTAHYNSDYFCTFIRGEQEEIIAYASFIQSSKEPQKWFYTDLWVAKEHRRQGLATQIVKSGIKHLSDLCAKTLLCTVAPNNEASLKLQLRLGFNEINTEPFERFEVEGLKMFALSVPSELNIIPLTDNLTHLLFICNLLTDAQNSNALHLKPIDDDKCLQFRIEMRDSLVLKPDENELNYVIRKGSVAIGWLKLNGLESDDCLWISMLVIHKKYRNIGASMLAVNFAEKTAQQLGKNNIFIYTTADNLPALSLYKKAGYCIVAENQHLAEDGGTVTKYKLHKRISPHQT